MCVNQLHVCVHVLWCVCVCVHLCVCISVCLSICVSVCHTRILSKGPPKQADIAMRGKPCFAIVKLEMASEGGRATQSQFSITEHSTLHRRLHQHKTNAKYQ